MVIDGKYRVNAVIGEGGMSSIYEAEHLGLDRRVAIKVLHPSLAEDPEAIARLRHEAQVVSTIGHPNICEVFDLGRIGSGSPYLVMELLVGESLAERLKIGGPMSFMELSPLLKQVLVALESAHDKGIIHRDLKPENVFIEAPRRGAPQSAKLLDFGISKSMSYEFQEEQRLTHTGMVMGTPYYMAPEQARGDSGLDQRVDLWAVGVMMYEAMTGRRPFVATNYNALLVKILTSRPRPAQKLVPTIPDVVAAIIERALSKLREDRFQTAREFLDALTHAQRLCAAEDPAAPTMMFRRPRDSAQRPSRAHGSQHGWEIDDPSTFIDDDFDYDPSQVAGPLREYEPPAYSPPAEYQSYEDYDVEPIEATIRDRAIRDDPHDAAVRQRRDATEVLGRPIRERLSSAPDSWSDTDVMARGPLFSEAENTEVVIRPALEAEIQRAAPRPAFVATPSPARPTPPVPPPTSSQTKTEPHRSEVPAPPPSHRTVVVRPEVLEADARADREAARARAPRGSAGGEARRGPPRIPRPDPRPDDDEKTTLYNPELARALRERGNDSGKPSDE